MTDKTINESAAQNGPAVSTSKRPARQAWTRPSMTVIASDSAETGVNSTTDATNTFS